MHACDLNVYRLSVTKENFHYFPVCSASVSFLSFHGLLNIVLSFIAVKSYLHNFKITNHFNSRFIIETKVTDKVDIVLKFCKRSEA